MSNKKILAIIQARTNSTRFPNKILKKIGKLSLIEILYNRISMSKRIDQTVVATTSSYLDDSLIKILKKNQINYYRGSESDVLKRYYLTAKKFKADVVVRITADCPLVDPNIVDDVINLYFKKKGKLCKQYRSPYLSRWP
jgi:glutamate-1-semialdehyde 2,1-aminomutase